MRAGSPFRPQALLSFPFFALGLASFIALMGWLLVRPGVLFEAARAPGPLSFVHLTVLGWLASFVFGAAYQLIPVISEARLWSLPLAWVHLGLHLVGAPHFLAAMLRADFAAAGTWGGVVAAGMLLGVGNLLLTAGARSRWTPENTGLLLALFWLTVTVGVGVLLALARIGRFSAFEPGALLRLHLSCGVVGFFVGTLVAVSFKLVPMFLLSPGRSQARAWTSIVLLNSGLLLLGPGLLGELNALVITAAVAVAGGVGVFLVDMAVLVHRRLRPLDWPLRTFLAGLATLAPATIAGALVTLASAGVGTWQPERAGLAVFILVVFGVLTPCILGMAGKIVPFLAWQWRYADHVGRARVPMVSDLFRVSLLRVQFFATVPAVGALVAAALLGSPEWARAGAAGFLVSAVAFAVNAAGLVPHIVQPRLAPLAGPAPSALSSLASVRKPTAQP